MDIFNPKPEPQGMKAPCNTCHVAICTYWEYPCSHCIHNPHSKEEIEKELKFEVGTPANFYRHYKENKRGDSNDSSGEIIPVSEE